MARQGGAAAAGQQMEAVIQAGGDLLHREQPDPRRSQLDRQRDAIQPAANCATAAALSSVIWKPSRQAAARSWNSRTASYCLSFSPASGSSAPGMLERRHIEHRFARDAQRLPAGRQDMQVRAATQQSLDQLGAGFDQVLAVVQHQ